jgi:uncharacterized RDD family membrane protein YckC
MPMATDASPTPGSIAARLGAAFIDFVAIALLLSLASQAWTTTSVENGVTVERPATAAYIFALGLRAAYDIVGVGRWGTTIGKRLARLGVVATDGTRAGWWRAVVRFVVANAAWSLAWFAPKSWSPASGWACLVVLLAVYAPVLVDDRRRGLHDRAAGTIVVATPA